MSSGRRFPCLDGAFPVKLSWKKEWELTRRVWVSLRNPILKCPPLRCPSLGPPELQAKTEFALQFLESCPAEVALQHSLFFSCNTNVIFSKSFAATHETALHHCSSCVAGKWRFSCRFPVDFRLPLLGSHVWVLLNRDHKVFPHGVDRKGELISWANDPPEAKIFPKQRCLVSAPHRCNALCSDENRRFCASQLTSLFRRVI